MLGGNCAGDFKLKPLLVYPAHNPHVPKNIIKPSLPVIWMANPKSMGDLLFLKSGSLIILSWQQKTIARKRVFLLRYY